VEISPLARSALEGLGRGALPAELLARAGEPDPARGVEAFAQAAKHPDLSGALEAWVPALLATARPAYGAQTLESLATAYRAWCHRSLPIARMPALPLLAGSSTFLARTLARRPHWQDELVGDPPVPLVPRDPQPDWSAIRTHKYEGLLHVVARDLLGQAFPRTLEDLSHLADQCLRGALACVARETGVEPPVLFGLGKLGGQELNLSSDVDLLFVYDAPEGDADFDHNRAASILIRNLKKHLEAPDPEGFIYRVDLDLRPEGETGPLANSVRAALSYYESFGADWERQMLMRLRYVAGPREVAESFQRQLQPFVFRRAIDPAALRRVKAMKQRIEDERRRAGRDLESDLKEGPGGIRDVEFLVQALQLFLGGRQPEIRTGNVLAALEALGRAGVLAPDAVRGLSDGYVWLRRAEHALQVEEERQIQTVPREPAARLALARRMGYREEEGRQARDRFLDDWSSVRSEVRTHFDALVLEEER
jgi:glutamate-ammonia-ligase adenylyltransferase